MRFNVAGLLKSPPGTRRRVTVDDALDFVSEDAILVGPIVGELSLIRELTGVLVDGTLRTTLQVACSRCLEPVDVEVDLYIEEHFRPTVFIPGTAIERSPEDAEDPATVLDAQHTLDLSEVLRQSVLLAVPLHALCSESCSGLCPECGTDLNRAECDCEAEPDPRWSALRALFEDG